MKTTLKRNSKVNLIRENLSTYLAQSIATFCFFNVGTVHKVSGDRVCVAWPGSGYLWFDLDAVSICQ